MSFPHPRGPAAHRARLILVRLESREGPSSLTGLGDADLSAQLPTPPSPGPIVAPPVPVPNQAPVISGFSAIVGPNGRVTFAGSVTDDQPVAGLVVTITGPGVTATAIVAADGTFRVTTTVFGTAPTTVTARVTDALGATSDPAQTTFTPSP